MPQFNDALQNERLDELKKQEAEDLARVLSVKYGLPYLDLASVSINTNALRLVDEQEARLSRVAAFGVTGKHLEVAVLSPKSDRVPAIIDMLKRKGFEPSLYMVSQVGLDHAFEFYKEVSMASKTEAGLIDIVSSDLEELVAVITDVSALQTKIGETITSAKGQGTSRVLEVMLAGAIAIKASDIHLEPTESATRVRYRVDGVLADVAHLTTNAYRLITSRIKLISDLKLNLREEPQDGRFSIKLAGREIEVRTSVLPGPYGETIVLRLLDPESIKTGVRELGMLPYLERIILAEIEKPTGMILVTGPTGSGKTTSLYAFLSHVNKPGLKIITIEDPIEYHLDGITQTNVHEDKGYTFLTGLRSSLRQDPDIIMVGEIRDGETANTAIQAALTGHLVFSTLHTNNAAGAIPRLIDLGVNPKIISSALSVSIAQRLVRTLCEKCKTVRDPSVEEAEQIERVLAGIVSPHLNVPRVVLELYEARGCADCNQTGYRGRIGIFEAILLDKTIEDLIPMNPSEREIKEVALKQGILSMPQDGVLKVVQGRTTLAELLRVVTLDEAETSEAVSK